MYQHRIVRLSDVEKATHFNVGQSTLREYSPIPIRYNLSEMISPVTLTAGPVPGPLVAAPLLVLKTGHQPYIGTGAELVFASPLLRLPLEPGHGDDYDITLSLMGLT